ncbi:MAG: FCD domain-containing protein, partial [Paracoccaceae bacterium]|nr:FCD domain-containing protein [Paracoccaceae bacterium]
TAPVGQLLFSATLDLYRTVPAARHRLLQAHREIAAAVAARDGATARLWMQRHIRDFRRGYEIAGFDMNAPIELRRQHTG